MSETKALNKPIVLCGYMGCGKTTVGKLMSQSMGREFVDMDDYICDKLNMTVNEIFEKYSEKGFRDYEHEACCELAQRSDIIVAAGGGAITFERNVKALHEQGCVIVFLDVPFDIIVNRILSDNTRPMINSVDNEAKIAQMKQLYDKRYQIYLENSDIHVKCGEFSNKTAVEVQKIIENMAK